MNSLILIFTLTLFGSARGLINKGNKLYHNEKYKESLEAYKEAQVKIPKFMPLDYNIGCAQYKSNSYNEAVKGFTKIISSLESKELKQKAFYNLGNTMFKAGDLNNAIEMYKQALRLKPSDIDAKINLEFAQKMLKENEQQKKQDNKQKDKSKQDKEKQKEQKDKGNQDKEKQKQEQEQKLSQQSAKDMLEALNQDEKSAKEKSQQKQAKRQQAIILKDW